MKKYIKYVLLAVLIAFSFAFSVPSSADTGPKPYVKIQIEGNTKGMYMTLLGENSYNGPWVAYDESYSNRYEYGEEEFTINNIFIEYKDPDNFYYLQYYQSIENNEFEWGYYPPYRFKVLIYDSINEIFITNNNIYERYSFGSTYKMTLDDLKIEEDIESSENIYVYSEDGVIIERNDNIWIPVFEFFVRVVICLAIEIGIALLFRFKKPELLGILIINVITQVIFNLVLSVIIYYRGYHPIIIILVYILAELIILLVETIFNIIFIKKTDSKHDIKVKSWLIILLYTFVANLASLFVGFEVLVLLAKLF